VARVEVTADVGDVREVRHDVDREEAYARVPERQQAERRERGHARSLGEKTRDVTGAAPEGAEPRAVDLEVIRVR
jgi:hypothetical protein